MRAALVLALVVGALSAVVLALVNGWWGFAPVALGVGGCTAGLWAVGRTNDAARRMGAVHAVVTEAVQSGARVVSTDALAGIISDPELDRLRAQVRSVEDELWRRRFARGEASDY